MIITTEINPHDFKFWSGAAEWFAKIPASKWDEFDSFIEEVFPEGCTDTELNDLLWFEPEFVFNSIGLDIDGNPIDEDDNSDDDEDDSEDEE